MSGIISAKEKLVLAFNKFFFDFIKDLNKCSSTLKDKNKQKYKVAERSSTQYYDCVSEMLTEDVVKVFMQADDILQSDTVCNLRFVDHSTVGDIASELNDEDVVILKSYIYIFVLLVHISRDFGDDETVNNKLLETVLIILGKIQTNVDYEDDLQMLIDDDMKHLLKRVRETYESKSEETEAGPKLPFDFNPEMIENTSIGNLAKEIAQEIDLSEVKIDKPEDIFNLANLTNSDNVIGNIVNKVGSKLQNKLSNGELKQDQLISEAMGFFNMMNKNNNMFNNPLMKDILKNVAGGNARINESKLRAMSTKDRLRKKLEEKGKHS